MIPPNAKLIEGYFIGVTRFNINVLHIGKDHYFEHHHGMIAGVALFAVGLQ